MTLDADVLTISDPVSRAAAANELLWTARGQSARLRETRRRALREAIDGGRSLEEVAQQLRVCPDDLAWMSE